MCLELYYQNVANGVAFEEAAVSCENYFNTQEQLDKNAGLTIREKLRDSEFSGHKIKLQNGVRENDVTI